MSFATTGNVPGFGVPTIATPSRCGTVEVHLVTFVVAVPEARVTDDAGGVGLASSTVPGNISPLKDVSTGPGSPSSGG